MSKEDIFKSVEGDSIKHQQQTKLIGIMLRMASKDVTATSSLQDKYNEKYGLVPEAIKDNYTDLIITLENTPEQYRIGLIKMLAIRYFSTAQLLSLRDFANEIVWSLLRAIDADDELKATAKDASFISELFDDFE